MKKIILLCIVTLMALSAFAQSPRLMSMGHVHGYIADDSDIFMFPATIHKYSNSAYAYLGDMAGNVNNYNFGINYDMSNFVIGAYFNKPIPWFARPVNIVVPNINMDKKFEMFLGFSENMAINFNLAMDSYAEPVADPDNDDTESFMMFGLGFGYSTDMMDLGFHFEMPMISAEMYTAPDNSVEMSENKMGFDLGGRMTFAQMGAMDLVGKINFDFETSTYDDGVDGTDDTVDSFIGFDLGIAGVLNPDENNKIVLGITPFGLGIEKTEIGDNMTSDTEIVLPAFNAGFESKVCKWLVVRAGAEQEYSMDTNTVDAGTEVTTTMWNSDFTYNMGLGVMWKNFTMDFVLNEDFLHDGPNLVTGQNTVDLAAELMIKYKF